MSASIRHIPASPVPTVPLRLTTTTRLIAAQEHTLTGVRGLTWVTLDHDLRDTVLGSGQRWTVPANRMVVITSLVSGGAFEATLTLSPTAKVAGAAKSAHRNAALIPVAHPSLWQRVVRPLSAALASHAHRGSPA
jgi:hypothetical protein